MMEKPKTTKLSKVEIQKDGDKKRGILVKKKISKGKRESTVDFRVGSQARAPAQVQTCFTF